MARMYHHAKYYNETNNASVMKVWKQIIGESWEEVATVSLTDSYINYHFTINSSNCRIKITVDMKSANLDNLRIQTFDRNVYHDVSFNNEGNLSVVAVKDTRYVELLEPLKEEHTLEGWYVDSGLLTKFDNSLVTSSFTLYAKWTVNQYTISFNSNGGSAVSSITQNFGTSVSQPGDPTRDDYDFLGWFSDEELTTAYVFDTMPAENITLYADWDYVGTVPQFTVTFESEGGSSVDSQLVNENDLAVIPDPAPTKPGYVFDGWHSDDSLLLPFDFNTPIVEDVSLYAKWVVEKKLMIYEVYGGGGNTGAIYRNDYVVLYNSTDSSINLAGYSIQYASVTGYAWENNLLALSGMIESQGYYLIKLASGTGNGVDIPENLVNLTGTINLSATAGKIALVNSKTALTGTDPSSHSSVVDFVGYGTNANGFEGSGPTIAPSNSQSIKRKSFVDTNDNAYDFEKLTPNLSYLS